jgi:hypothetical protein
MIFFRKIIEIVIVFYPFIVSGEINQTVKNGIFELSLTQTEEECHLVYSSPLNISLSKLYRLANQYMI